MDIEPHGSSVSDKKTVVRVSIILIGCIRNSPADDPPAGYPVDPLIHCDIN